MLVNLVLACLLGVARSTGSCIPNDPSLVAGRAKLVNELHAAGYSTSVIFMSFNATCYPER